MNQAYWHFPWGPLLAGQAGLAEQTGPTGQASNELPVTMAGTSPSKGLTIIECDWPETGWGLALFWGVCLGLAAYVIWQNLRESRGRSWGFAAWLIGLRLAVIAALATIFLGPQERTQEMAYRPSRVAIAVDTSLSMRHPSGGNEPTGEAVVTTRAERAAVLVNQLTSELRAVHEVSVFSFDRELAGPHAVLAPLDPETQGTNAAVPSASSPQPKGAMPAKPIDWTEILRPQGLETRLGESLVEGLRVTGGRTLSGLVVVTDGASNAGLDVTAARDRAASAKTPIYAIGLGSLERPVNVQLADLQCPTEVQLGDPFDVVAFLRTQGLAGQTVDVELLQQPATEQGEPIAVEVRQQVITEDEVPIEVRFSRQPAGVGSTRYVVRTKLSATTKELNSLDNSRDVVVNVFDRPTRVLIVAGGPMRDYQFVRNLVHRHKSMQLDLYLQTARRGTSQESTNLLTEFPASREEILNYDAIIAFDPDWQAIPADRIKLLSEWVAEEAGGLILVAGDVFTSQLLSLPGLSADEKNLAKAKFEPLLELYPVVLTPYLAELRFEQEASQPWPISFSEEGQSAAFLQLTDAPATSLVRWKDFPGFYRCYPTSGVKSGGVVYARFSDPRSQNAVLMASQFYGQGRTFYLGSGEMWRLRAVSEDDYDRFWIKTIREFSQGRLKRGSRRGLLLPELRKASLGQTIRVRARLLDTQFKPQTIPSIPLEVITPQKKPLIPVRQLVLDPNRKGEYVGDFRASLPGTYRLTVIIPETQERLAEDVIVELPRLEDEDLRQNANVLASLVQETGGAYLQADEAVSTLPKLLANKGEPYLVDQRLKTLWDKDWLMYLIAGLLSLEWLTRKLLRLA